MHRSLLSPAEKEQITTQIDTLTDQGYRLIACAKKEVTNTTTHITQDLVHT